MGHNLPLLTRRRNAVGLSPRTQRAWRGRRFISLGNGRRASVALPFTGNNNDVTLFAVAPGTGGNSITATVALGGTAPVVTYAGNAITVTAPAATTAVAFCDAVNRSSTTDSAGRLTRLVWAQLASGQDGTGTISAVGPLTLTGGTAAG